jgi:hypothetical protein
MVTYHWDQAQRVVFEGLSQVTQQGSEVELGKMLHVKELSILVH